MVQIKNISEVRTNIAQIMKHVSDTGESIIVIQDSRPVAEIVPFAEKAQKQTHIMSWIDELEKTIDKGKKLLLLNSK
jgi:prevent-host-death family protein